MTRLNHYHIYEGPGDDLMGQAEGGTAGFRPIAEMLPGRPARYPAASVCFLGARANRLLDARGQEPCFETVLHLMYEAGFRGDVYPAPWMWESAPTAMFPRYPF